MKLNDLVKTRNYLQQISTRAVKSHTEELDGKLNQIRNMPLHLDYRADMDGLLSQIDNIESQLDDIETRIPALIAKIDQELIESTRDFMERGYIINGFYGSNSTDVLTERNQRLLVLHDDTRAEVLVKARGYTNWHYPTLEIGPGDGVWTEHLVAGDPLYIVDVHPEFINSTLSRFNDDYRNRIRPYLTGMHAGLSDTD